MDFLQVDEGTLFRLAEKWKDLNTEYVQIKRQMDIVRQSMLLVKPAHPKVLCNGLLLEDNGRGAVNVTFVVR